MQSSCWHSFCTPGAIKAQQWPDFSSVTRSNGTANFPFITAVATEHLYEAERISDRASSIFLILSAGTSGRHIFSLSSCSPEGFNRSAVPVLEKWGQTRSLEVTYCFEGLVVKGFTKSACILYSQHYQAVRQTQYESKLQAFEGGLTKNKSVANIKNLFK